MKKDRWNLFTYLHNATWVQKVNNFFDKANLWVIALSWYLFTALTGLFFGFCLTPPGLTFFIIKFSLVIGLFFAFFGTGVTYNIRSSQKAWDKLTAFETKVTETESPEILSTLYEELNGLAQYSTGYNYNMKMRELKTIIDLKLKYLTK